MKVVKFLLKAVVFLSIGVGITEGLGMLGIKPDTISIMCLTGLVLLQWWRMNTAQKEIDMLTEREACATKLMVQNAEQIKTVKADYESYTGEKE